MKSIICPNCKDRAVAPGGIPIVMGRYTGGHRPIIVPCDRCKRAFPMDPQMFFSMPDATPEGTTPSH